MTEFAERYELRAPIGRGASSTVHEALDRLLDRRVAIKLFDIPAADDTAGADTLARFRAGARAAARLSHPNIVSVYDYGETERRAWLVMELVEGGTLKDLIESGKQIGLEHALDLLLLVLSSLGYSHRHGVVHRDVKPANIMMTRDGVPRLTDFGIARQQETSMTIAGTVMGTPAYMAPEQFEGTVDHRADLWSVGVIFYQLATGQRPFDGTYATIMHKVMSVEPPPPSAFRTGLPPALDELLAKALAKKPDDRFQSADAFAAALRNLQRLHSASGPDVTVIRTASPGPRSPMLAVEDRPLPIRQGARRGRGRLVASCLAGVAIAAGVASFVLLRPSADTGAAGPHATATGNTPGSAATGSDVPRPGAAESPARTAMAALPAMREVPPPSEPVASPRVALPERAPAAAPVPPPQRAEPTAAPQALPVAVPVLAPRVEMAASSVPPPAAPAAPVAPMPRVDPMAAAATATQAVECGLVAPQADGERVVLSGLVQRDGVQGLRRLLGGLGMPEGAADLQQLQTFDADFCSALAAIRPATAARGGPRIMLTSPQPLLGGQSLGFRVETPEWPAFLHVVYITNAQQAGNLVQAGPSPYAPRSVPAFGQPFWQSSPPWGTDLILAVASERPLFPTPRRISEQASEVVPALAAAIQAQQEAGRRVAAWAITHRKEPR